MSSSLGSHELYSPWTSPGQNTGVGSLSLLQRIFPTQVLNPGLLHCRQILYQLSHCTWGPHILTKVMMGWREEMVFLEFRAPRFPSRSWKQSGPASRSWRQREWRNILAFSCLPISHLKWATSSQKAVNMGAWKQKPTCRGPAPAGSRGTLRMNSIGEGERERKREKKREREGEREKDQRLGVSSRVRQCFIFYCSFNTLS